MLLVQSSQLQLTASTTFTTNKVCEDQQPKKEEPKSTDIADDPVKRQLGEMIQGLPLTLLQQSVSHES